MLWSWLNRTATAQEQEHQEDDEEEEEMQFMKSMHEDGGLFERMLSRIEDLDNKTATRMLGWAARKEPPDVISKIGKKCADISAWALQDKPALHIALQYKHALGVQELLRMGADVNGTSGHCVLTTALHVAVHAPCLACLDLLLERADVEVDAISRADQTALHLCVTASCESDDIEEQVFADMAAALITRGANIEESVREGNITPLSSAVGSDKCLVVAQMLRVGKKPPAPVVASYMEGLRDAGDENMLELFVEAGWGPRVLDDARTRAAAGLNTINGVHKPLPPATSKQRSSGNRVPSPLHDAARSGNVSKLVELLSSGKDVNAVDTDGRTALHAAATSGHDDVVEALLRAKGISVDKPDRNKVTALYMAAKADHAGAVKALLKAKASRDVKNAKGRSVLHEVVKRPAGAVIEALIGAGVSPGLGGEKGFTPLHTACEVDARGTVEALLRGGALAGHCWNDSLQSPLMVACKHGNLNAVQQLLLTLSPRQINMRSSSSAGAETALVAAIRCLDLKMEIVTIVEALLAAEADPHIRTGPINSSALTNALVIQAEDGGVNGVAASSTIGPPLVRALVAAGANVNEVTSHRGYSPFHVACGQGACVEVLQVLLDAGADPYAPCAGDGFMSPLLLAASHGGDPGAVRLLIEQPKSGGLNVVGSPPDRLTPLSAAVRAGQTEVVRYLLEEGADMDLLPFVDDVTPSKESLIELAASLGKLDTMNLLIQAKMFKDKAEEQQQQQQQLEDAGTRGVEEDALC